ncbi:FCGR3 protein, partial [Alca torda]|nr:FCGR3 protein [Alca torda]
SPAPPPLADWLVLQVPTRALLEGDELRLRCRGWANARIRGVRFFREREALGEGRGGGELLLSPLQPPHGGRYWCQAEVHYHLTWNDETSAPVTV